MKQIALAIVLTAGCSGGHEKSQATAGSGAPVYAKRFALSWGIEQAAAKAELFLQATDETGKQTSYPLGTYDGQCQVITPAAGTKAATAVTCSSGIEIDAVIQEAEVIVLKGKGGDPMSREEVTRVSAPPGAKIQVGS